MNDRATERREAERRMLPFFVEFVRFCSGFAVLIAVALITLRVVGGP